MSMPRSAIRALAVLACAATVAAGLPAAAGEPLEAPAYRTLLRADELRDAGRGRRALRHYRAALAAFEVIQRDFPDYRPATMAFRADYCRTQIARLEAEPAPDPEPESDAQALLLEARAEAERWRSEAERLAAKVETLEGRVTLLQLRLLDAEVRGAAPAADTPVPPEMPDADYEPGTPAGPSSPPAEANGPELAARRLEADARLGEGDAAAAAALYRGVLDEAPEDRDARLGLASALMAQGETREARRIATALRRAFPEDPAPAHLLGVIARREGQRRTAVRRFQEAVERAPEVATLRFDLAVACHEAGHTAEAIEHFLAAAQLDPENGRAQFNLAALLSTDPHRHADARRCYERAMELGEAPDPQLAERIGLYD